VFALGSEVFEHRDPLPSTATNFQDSPLRQRQEVGASQASK
jgi:hypothetical protein